MYPGSSTSTRLQRLHRSAATLHSSAATLYSFPFHTPVSNDLPTSNPLNPSTYAYRHRHVEHVSHSAPCRTSLCDPLRNGDLFRGKPFAQLLTSPADSIRRRLIWNVPSGN